MERVTHKSSFSIFERAKSFFQHLRWLFCLSTFEEINYDNNKRTTKSTSKIKNVSEYVASDQAHSRKENFNWGSNNLPEVCLEMIFSHLPLHEKGMASQVCKYWNTILKRNSFWTEIDFTYFKLICSCNPSTNNTNSCSSSVCYNSYKVRLKKFFNFLLKYQFCIKSLKLSFDIIDCVDNWDVFVQSMWKNLNLKDLKSLYFNWLITPEKPQWLTRGSGAHTNDLQLLQRRRTRRFESILKLIVTSSCKLTSLSLPFEWTDTCVELVCGMYSLHSLTLSNCPNRSSCPTPVQLDLLLKNLSLLQHLETFVTHHALHRSSWSVESESLESFKLTSEHSHPSFHHLHLPNCSQLSLDVLQNATTP